MSKVFILPYLRKGLAKEIKNHSKDGLRADFTVTANLRGFKPDAGENDPAEAIPAFVKEFSLAGPVDVRAISDTAVSEVVPADKSVGYSFGYMPYVEFYEEDFPWRYTPKEADQSGKLEPWLLLLACKDDEFTLTKDNKGYRRVTFDPKERGFYPAVADFYKLAHVQVTMPDFAKSDTSADVASYVNENPDDGISRLFCVRPLEEKCHYTMFLVPAFELGRRAGMGESLEGAGFQQLAWDDQSSKLSFPVYYQWSFTTGGATFHDLAKKQTFISDDEFKALPDGLKLDIQETGLKEYRTYTQTINEDKVLVDMPAALVKKGFDESKLVEETPQLKKMTRGGTNPVHMTDELKKLQLMSPVFSQNERDKAEDKEATMSETEDPWVVPPVYGARHILASRDDLDNEKLFLGKLNLRFRNRAAAGLGVSVVKRNQEAFVNRAWGMIDTINAWNQRIREYNEAVKANGASSKKATSLSSFKFQDYALGLQADAAIRVANAQSAAKVNAVDLAMDMKDQALSGLSVRSSVFQPIVKACGISKDELYVISDRSQWEKNWDLVARASQGFKFMSGGIPFFEGGIDERYGFLRPIFYAGYPEDVKLEKDEEGKVKPVTDSDDKLIHFRCDNMSEHMPVRSHFMGIKDYLNVIDWLNDGDICRFHANHSWWFNSLDSMISCLNWAKEDYAKRWGENSGTKLHQMCLPVKTTVYDGSKLVGYAFFMLDKDYEPFRSDYPNGFYFAYQNYSFSYKLFILPQEKFEKVEEGAVEYTKKGWTLSVIKDPEQEGRFKLETDFIAYNTAIDFSPDDTVNRGFNLWGVRNHMIKDSNYYKLWSTLIEKEGASTEKLMLFRKGSYEFYSGKRKSGTVRRLWLEWRDYDKINVMGDFYTHSKKKICGRTYYYDTHSFWISINDECVIPQPKLPNVVLVDMPKLMAKVQEWMSGLDWVDDIFWSPNCAKLKSSSVNGLPEVKADQVGKLSEKIDDLNAFLDEVYEEADKFRAQLKPILDKEEPAKSQDVEKADEKPVDADEENRKRLLEITQKFAESGMSLDLSESNFDGKYPIMAYPIFPDPTSFYLRELSERFILPSVDKLKLNSISCFVTNPIFEEAFLAGMNTEMGRELLWREYPTDERGSYFRKFWDQVDLPSDFSKGYFDVKYLHNWKKRLGANHEDGKGQLVVFIIKSELMMMYPQTGITLSIPKDGVLDNVLAPTMTGWLADDTYMAGFDISKLSTTEGLYLTFTETDKSQRFTCLPRDGENYPDLAGDLSTQFAVKHKIDGTVWGHQVDKGYLVVNDLHLDDDDDDGSGNLAGNGSGIHVVPKPNQDLNLRQELDKDIRPELKR